MATESSADELNRLDIRRELFQSSQQHWLLKPILVLRPHQRTLERRGLHGLYIPAPVTPPDGQPAPFPENLPEAFRAKP